MSDEIRDQISQIIEGADVALFMKGTPETPLCGNSERALQALRKVGAPVIAVNVLPDPRIREQLSAISGWPTIPQIFVKGELVGGADITEELAESGELEQLMLDRLGPGYEEEREEQTAAVFAF
jgi:monothiol glutaredoxin